MSTLKVDGIRSNSASSDAITLASDGTCTANITNGLSNRNLIINGAMQVAQRGTSSTTSGYGSVDRFHLGFGGTDEAITQSQINVAPTETGAGTAGFRNAFRITNGNQTSGFGTTDYFQFHQMIEDQNIANSGWIVNDPNSFITVSYWIRSSVAQQFFGFVETSDGADWMYGWTTGVLTADTWTKITKTIPGRSNLSWSNDNGHGLLVAPVTLWGTDRTDNSVGNDAWHAYASSSRTPDATSTWWTTNDATIDITGLQVEVGSFSSDFEFRSYGDELLRSQRYYQVSVSESQPGVLAGRGTGTSSAFCTVPLTCSLRASPSLSGSDFTQIYAYLSDGRPYSSSGTVTTNSSQFNPNGAYLNVTVGGFGGNIHDDRIVNIGGYHTNNKLTLDAEL